jgi:hypothetical protein
MVCVALSVFALLRLRFHVPGNAVYSRCSIEMMVIALDAYHVDVGAYPVHLQQLIASGRTARWKGPYITCTEVPRDNWGTPYRYMRNPDRIELRSAGPDRQFDTEDDVWALWKMRGEAVVHWETKGKDAGNCIRPMRP